MKTTSLPTSHANEVKWNSTKFLNEYIPLKNNAKRPNVYNKIKFLRVNEYYNTIIIVRQGFYTTEQGNRVTLPPVDPMIHNTVFYKNAFQVDKPSVGPTAVEVINDDCLTVGIRLKKEGYHPAILNMASRHNPGGGVITGAGAQEETLFRRTNLYLSLYQFAPYAEQYGLQASNNQYPLDRNFGGVYTPSATIFREPENQGFRLMEEPEEMAFIAVAGINQPDLTPGGLIVPNLVEPVKNKIRTIFRIGLQHDHDALVLGALGCGAFKNPPQHIAQLFHEVLQEDEFHHKFKLIVFSILEDHNAYHAHNPEGNFKPFAREFKGMERSAIHPIH